MRTTSLCSLTGACLLVGTISLACGETEKDNAGVAGESPGGSAASSSGSSSGGGTASAGSGTGGSSGTPATGGAPGTSGSAGKGSVTPPTDPRPEPPDAWAPPEVPLGEGGWEESEEPLCENHAGAMTAFDVWADSRGVFSLFGATCNVFGNTCSTEGGGALQFNDGKGWKWLYQAKDMGVDVRITGFANGPLVLTGSLDNSSGIFFFEDGELELVYPSPSSLPTVFVAGPSTAYAFANQDILEYSGGAWKTLTTLPSRPLGIWGSGETLVVVAEGEIYRRTSASEELEPMEAVPAGTYTAVWGSGNEEIWAGNAVGQIVHYNGADWTVIETGAEDPSNATVISLWGASDVLYFATYADFGRVDANGVERIIKNSKQSSPSSIWGRSASEVFLGLGDANFQRYACGGALLLWFDGSEFHRF